MQAALGLQVQVLPARPVFCWERLVDYAIGWIDRLIYAVAVIIVGFAVGFAGLLFHEIFGAEPNRRRSEESAWRERCAAKGGTVLPTERSHGKGGDRYGGWICARIARFDP